MWTIFKVLIEFVTITSWLLELMFLDCGVGEDSWESLGLQGDPCYRKSVLSVHWKDWCWSWSSNTLATWCKELTHWKRPWSWERLKAGREGDERGWDGWMASLTRWTWAWASSGSWWWTGKPGVLQSLGSQGVGHDWATELNCTVTVWVRWSPTQTYRLTPVNMKALLPCHLWSFCFEKRNMWRDNSRPPCYLVIPGNLWLKARRWE